MMLEFHVDQMSFIKFSPHMAADHKLVSFNFGHLEGVVGVPLGPYLVSKRASSIACTLAVAER